MNIPPDPFLDLIQMMTDSRTLDQTAKKEVIGGIRLLMASYCGFSILERLDRLDFTRQLLAARTQRREIRDRLMVRFGVSKSTADRTIRDVLKLVHRRQDFDPPKQQTVISGEGAQKPEAKPSPQCNTEVEGAQMALPIT